MPWNEAGSNGPDEKDPWSRSQGQRRDTPPDLDEMLREAKNRLENLFGGGRRGGDSGSGRQLKFPGFGLFSIVFLVALGLWLSSGLYEVDQGEQAIEMRFGEYQETKSAGLHWHIPVPFEMVEVINTQRVNTVEVGYRKGSSTLTTVPREALMLTQDENIIDVQFAVQYDVKNATDLLFNVSEFTQQNMAETVVRQATESAVREIVGRSTMDFAITDGRAQLAAETKSLVQRILDRYQTGINVRTVEMQNAQPPLQVKNAFDDVVRAREDEERIKNLAQAYANDIIPRARGFAARIAQEAEAYKSATVAKAQGQTSRFEKILNEYTKAPQVTRDRLYLETMEEVLSKSNKMLIDQKGGNNVMYLPLDQLVRNRDVDQGSSQTSNSAGNQSAGSDSGSVSRSTNRNERN